MSLFKVQVHSQVKIFSLILFIYSQTSLAQIPWIVRTGFFLKEISIFPLMNSVYNFNLYIKVRRPHFQVPLRFPFTVHFISIKRVLSDHLSYVTIFNCSLGRSHKTGLTVYLFMSLMLNIS